MEKSLKQTFSSRLREEMKKNGLESAADLAKFADVGWTTANQWLTGTIPRKASLHNLASRLRVTSEWLMTGEGDKEPVNLQQVKDLEAQYGQPTNPNENLLKALAICLPHLPGGTLLTLLEIIQECPDTETLELKREILQLAKSKLKE